MFQVHYMDRVIVMKTNNINFYRVLVAMKFFMTEIQP